ncbi:winged helix-turn-helix transcriptional regulator [Streptomyces sp. LE64]|uniref:winged helix-turn-helix transcriptional regulator n=1 Tax=Streptomyces sp. LE64 TaxID=3448653 RepID=UPI004041A811
MDVVAGKWKPLILWELHHHGARRFAELRRSLPGVSLGAWGTARMRRIGAEKVSVNEAAAPGR